MPTRVVAASSCVSEAVVHSYTQLPEVGDPLLFAAWLVQHIWSTPMRRRVAPEGLHATEKVEAVHNGPGGS